MSTDVILVDEQDHQIGIGEKLAVHRAGQLHRCFSIFVFNSKGELLIQKRATGKYHSGGLWSNTCCSHPRPGEDINEAAHQRLQMEMGFDCELKEVFSFTYRVEFENGLTEHEFDHVFVGTSDATPVLNPEEASEWQWVAPSALLADMKKDPEKYTYWFRVSFNRVLDAYGTL